MRNSSLALLFGLAVFAIGVWNLVYDPQVGLKHAIEDVLAQGQSVMDNYTKMVEDTMSQSLATLFDELDLNGDGTIERKEFRGASINLMAAMRAMERQRPRLAMPSLPRTKTDALGLLQMVFTVQILFLVAIFILVHLHALVFGDKPNVDLASDYIHKEARRVTKDEAFEYTTPLRKAGLYEKAKMAFFLLSGLFFVRIVLVLLFFALGALGLSMSVLGGRNRHKNPRWFTFWASFTTLFGTLMLMAMGFSRVVFHGQLASDRDRKLLVANHVCVVEVVYLFLHGKLPSFVSRVENLSVPLFPAIVKASDSILVNRDATESRTLTLNTILRRVRDPDATPVMMFPEGTCDGGRALFQFKKGAFEAGQAVQMVCFKFPHKHFNPTWNGRAVGGNDLLDLVVRLLCQFVNHCEVVYLPVYTPTPAERDDPTLYANHVQSMMANVLMLPVSDASYKDYLDRARSKHHHKQKHHHHHDEVKKDGGNDHHENGRLHAE